jgi:aldose 1-epimerase
MPWPNRIRDGRYAFGDAELQLPLTEPSRGNASHGLARWVAWTVEEHTANSVSLQYRLMAQTGYPWLLDLHVLYDLSANGLTVTQTATNMSTSAAPYASGAHPYLAVGQGPLDGWELTLPAATRSLTDDRLLPVGTESVEGTAYDFRVARPLRDTVLNHAFTDLERDDDGRATVTLRDPGSGAGVALWVDERHPWLQLYTADDVPATARRSIAVEPMTANADAFRTGEDLVTLAPAGQPGDEHTASWGVRAVD